MKFDNVLQAVGRTPLIRLNRINRGLKPQIHVKAEYFNPGGSVKDRIAIHMIDQAERRGDLKPGGTIGIVDFYVAHKYPEEEHARHGWFTRTFWPSLCLPGIKTRS